MGVNNVPDKMKALQLVEFKKPYELNDVKTPKDLQPYDILLKIAVASLCHTDSMVSNGIMGTQLPCIPSHEPAGTVVAIGSEVQNFKEGDRVMAGIGKHPCGRCGDCQGPENYSQYCAHQEGYVGVTIDGAFAEYCLVDSRTSAKLPDNVSFETAAPLACAGCTVFRGVLQADLKKGEWICLVGSGGGLGHLGVQFAKALGLMVIGIDARDEGLELTRKFGADLAIDARSKKEDIVKQVHSVTAGAGADATVVLSDHDSAAETGAACTKMHGNLIQIAQPDYVKIPFAEFVFRDIRVKGSLICSPEEARQMLDVVSKNSITVITNPVKGLDKVKDLVELAHSGKMKGKGVCVVDQSQVDKEKEGGLKMV